MIRVTQVLDYFAEPELVAWQLRVGKVKAEQISSEAKRIGSAVDQAIQLDLKGMGLVIPPGQPEIESCLIAWMKFKDQYPQKVKAVQQVQLELLQERNDLVGHADIELVEEDAWSIGDVKTGSMIRPKYWTQVAKYAQMRAEQGDRPGQPFYTWILRLDKARQEFEYKEMRGRQLEEEMELFEAYLRIYRHGQVIRDWMRVRQEQEALGDVA